jgi:hypothetical protein
MAIMVLSHGYYIMEGDTVVMTDAKGVLVRRGTGNRVTHELKPDEDAATWARLLTRQLRQHIHGGKLRGFSGPLRYEKTGWR